ncbi:MAG: CusA/CzcA family heavy metal efflux RND transporter [Elusimicrobia bacterium CG08_land_8_20_14_0_20_51_18]|nr:MAG: CusA/CzcA family heavy metal efflux RND transporter [Elusimicrobia bacterium CG08_land_8_20_14_0_20_51_18]
MLKRTIAFSAENKYLVMLIFLALGVVAFRALKNTPVDAIPDLSDTQVIIYSKWDRAPRIIEDQLTYPVITALLGAPKVKTIRGFSDYGYSFVYVIFEDGTDIYWARSRALEYLSKITPQLPQEAKVELGPDATGVGWIFQYALADRSGKRSASELRSYQDWNLKYRLQSVEGVSEVASVGGFQKEYQITINPRKLLSYGITVQKIIKAVKESNGEAGARLMEFSGFEHMVTVKGYIKSVADIENIPVLKDANGIPVLLKNVAEVKTGPQLRRGAGDLNGEGDAVSGIIVMRHKENALKVIERVKDRLEEIKKSLPEGMELITVYDRSDLIKKAIATLKRQLTEEMIIVSLVILLFLWHIPSAVVAIITIPVSVLLSFIIMRALGINSNIMSLSGIAISVGVLVDGAIVEVENAYKKLELWEISGRKGDFHKVRLEAIQEVIPSVFFSLLVIAVSFIPIFALADQEGKLFKPLAWTKTLTITMAAFLALTLDPALRMAFSRMNDFNLRPKFLSSFLNAALVGKYYPEEKHPVSALLFRIYSPVCDFVLRKPKTVIIFAALAVVSTIPVFMKLGGEFMPPLKEGTVLYMPTTLPGISIEEARKILKIQDSLIKSFPEVETVYGKAGRADTATDPAPLSMMETVIVLKPQEDWREKKRWYSGLLPGFAGKILRHIWYDRITYEELISEMDSRLKIPGFANAWTMPIKGRIDMLSTGIRTPVGIKVFGDDIYGIEKTALEIEQKLKNFKNTRSVYAERVAGGYFVEIEPDRLKLARYNLSVREFQEIIANTVGAEQLTTTVEGRERYPVTVRYPRDLRSDIESLKRVLVTVSENIQIPLEQLAEIKTVNGASMIRDENGSLACYVYVDIEGIDVGTYVASAKKYVSENVKIPEGYSLVWSGQYENMIRVKERLKLIVPLTIFTIFLLLYANTRSFFKTALIMCAVPFSLTGAFWFIYLLDYNLSIAVWVGIIALAGLDAETGIFMLLYLDLSYDEMRRKKAGSLSDRDLKEAITHGAVKRIRPKMMTVAAAFMGLIPIMWSLATGSELMKRIAAPMIGGLFTSFALELLVYPAVYYLWKKPENS